MSVKPLLTAILSLAFLTAPARAEDGVSRVRFTESYGPMTPKYARELSDLGRLDSPDLEAWRKRLLTLRNLKDATFTLQGDRIDVSLTETPYVVISPKVLPFVLPVGLEVIAEDWRLGGQYYDFKAWAGYVWSGVTLYEPNQLEAAQRGNLSYNFAEAYARGGVMVLPYTRVYLEGKVAGADMAGNTAIASEYGTVGGAMVTVSPFLRFDDTDHPDMPRRGTRVRAGVLFGPKALGNTGDYLRYDAAFQEYVPLGELDSLAIGLHGGAGGGDLPLPQAYMLGAGNFLRGYTGSRFVGNQMLALSLELRHALWPSIMSSGVTLWSTAFVDAARSWNQGAAIAFPQDIRPSVGGYLGLSLGTWYIGRVEAAVGNEGPFVNIAAGLPFPW